MPVSPPMPDPSHIETRLLVIAEMLDRAVAEVHRAVADVKGGLPPAGDTKPDDDEARS